MEKCTYDNLQDDENIVYIQESMKFELNENYQYIKKNKIFLFFSNFLYYIIAFPILTILLKIIYDLKIEGKENIKNIKAGAISVSNHVLILDCAMVGIAFGMKPIYYTTQEGSFKIPLVRKLIKLLRAIPIPKNIKNKEHFIKEIDNALKENKIIHFYPEKALWPYYEKLREFKNGAFNLAIRNEIPIIPVVITFREPNKFRKIFKSKKDVTIKILNLVNYVDYETHNKKSVEELKNEVHSKMNEAIKSNEKQNK